MLLLEQDIPKLLIPAMEHMNAVDTAQPTAIILRQTLVDDSRKSSEFVRQFIAVSSASLLCIAADFMAEHCLVPHTGSWCRCPTISP